MILVVGANGFLGRETVRQLLAAGQRVCAAACVPDTVADLRQRGAEVVHADLIDPASPASACNGIDAHVEDFIRVRAGAEGTTMSNDRFCEPRS